MGVNTSLLDGMVIFVEVVTLGSFTLTAQKSGHSASYISKEISKLEERLGVRLLNRTTRSISLTPEGDLYFQQCQQIVLDAEHVENAVMGRQSEPKGQLRISCPRSFGLSRLRPVLADFIAQYPKITLDIDLNDRKVEMVADGFDILIRASSRLDDSSLVSRRFMRSYALTLASPEYLSLKGIPNSPSELSEHQTISYSNLKMPNIWDYQDLDGEPKQVKVNSRVMTNSPEMALSLCLAGQGITRLPYFNLSEELSNKKLVVLFDQYPSQTIDVFVVYPSRKHMSSKVRCFIDFIVETLGDENRFET